MSDNVQDTFNKLKLHPRLCHLIKWQDFNGYGFNLHAEKGKAGQFIGKVDEGSPAEAAFLYQGDRIIEVNGVNIGNENHQQVVQRIKAGGDETRLLVVDTETDIHFKAQKTVVRGEMPEVAYCKTPDMHGFSTPILNYNQTLETKQNAETGETTSQGIASGTTLITNGLSEDLPAPPPELIENGHEPTVERVTVSEVESEVKNIESDAIYDIPDAVPVLTTDSGSVKSGSEKSESDKQETNSIKTGSVKSEKVESEKGDSERAESEKAESEKGDSEKAESERAESEKAVSEKCESEKCESEKAESEKAESEKAESDIVAVVKSDIESIKAEANISNNEVAGTAKSYITKIPLDDLDSSPSFVKAVREPKEIDVSDPLNFVNVSAEEMKQKILSKKKARKFKDMNLKEKHEILDRL
ncbi:Na(+)/H(+) exchange regulatory cofactor NHE-RF3 isoform X1 [Octopus sinensis]|uniref:Na(+)/H(+) exchange regulatory cofactor NHE-RF3 isoform X1 n=1 Tax=Octopus sinensis TaxID=2607531 RepID=A0A6P7SG68_9MOLL|nr:Na(+)/H(+) exchange regulatory cofactor NHE-RF3 isoform X1 [Octopus sinensis]